MSPDEYVAELSNIINSAFSPPTLTSVFGPFLFGVPISKNLFVLEKPLTL